MRESRESKEIYSRRRILCRTGMHGDRRQSPRLRCSVSSIAMLGAPYHSPRGHKYTAETPPPRRQVHLSAAYSRVSHGAITSEQAWEIGDDRGAQCVLALDVDPPPPPLSPDEAALAPAMVSHSHKTRSPTWQQGLTPRVRRRNCPRPPGRGGPPPRGAPWGPSRGRPLRGGRPSPCRFSPTTPAGSASCRPY